MAHVRPLFAAGTAVASITVLVSCAPATLPLGVGPSDGWIEICFSEFTEPLTHGSPVQFAEGTTEATLVNAELIDAENIRVIEQAAAQEVLLADGTRQGIGNVLVSEGDEPWDGRVPLEGTIVRQDDAQWFLALALERTSDHAGGFDAIELTYEVDGREHVARAAESINFPAVGGVCEE